MSQAASFTEELERLTQLLKQSAGNVGLAVAKMAGEQNADALSRLGDQLAGLRWIDATLYSRLFAAQQEELTFAELTETAPWFLPDRLVAQGDGRFGWAGDAALERDIAWQRKDPSGHGAWHRQLANYFDWNARGAPPLDQFYHLYRCNDATAAELFSSLFEEFDRKFDVPSLHALLQSIERPEPAPGSKMWAERRKRQAYFAGRIQFRRDFQLTGRYFNRKKALASFNKVFNSDDEWIWHIHASGGVGKTTFLRWLITRHLLPDRARPICARIDFDDFRLDGLVERPLRALLSLLEQINRQLPDNRLETLLSEMSRVAQEPGFNEQALDSFSQRLMSQKIEQPVLVVLDTLEEAYLTQASWLVRFIDQIAALRVGMPQLKLALSGRYDLSPQLPANLKRHMVRYELLRFDQTEAQAYLEQIEGIDRADLRDAMLDRVLVEDADPKAECQRYNPFKLSLLAEVVRGDPSITPDDIAKMEEVAVAYLIERIVNRIPDQPLRWLIRYAVVARELDQAFLDAVLLPELREALLGTAGDDKVERDQLGSRFNGQDIWQANRDDASQLNSVHLLEQLRSYSSDRGWISIDGATAMIRLHPEVVDPMRKLLTRQKIYRKLNDRALVYARERGKLAETATDWIAAKSLELFHLNATSPDKVPAAWRKALKSAERWGGPAIAAVAREVDTLSSWAVSASQPAEILIQLQCEAELEKAKLYIEQAFVAEVENFALRSQIVGCIERALELAPEYVDPGYAELASRLRYRQKDSISKLRAPLSGKAGEMDTLGAIYCHLAIAWRLATLRRRDLQYEAIDHIEAARVQIGRAGLLTLTDTQLGLVQISLARSLADAPRARKALKSIRSSARETVSVNRQTYIAAAEVAFLDHDLDTAQGILTSQVHLAAMHEDPTGWERLPQVSLDLAIAVNNPLAELRRVTSAAKIGLGDPIIRIALLCRCGFAASILGEFDHSEDHFRHADSLIESTENAASMGLIEDVMRWRLRSALRGQRFPKLAQQLLAQAARTARGQEDSGYQAELAGFGIWAALASGDLAAVGEQLPNRQVLAKASLGTRWALALTAIGLTHSQRSAELVRILKGPLPAASELYLALGRLVDRTAEITPGLIDADALIKRLPKIRHNSPSELIDRIRQADLLRVLGRRDEARKLVSPDLRQEVTADSLLDRLEWVRCRSRLGLRSNLDDLCSQLVFGSELYSVARGMAAAFFIRAGQQTLLEHNWEKARGQALEARHHYWEQREPSGWSQRIWEVAALADQTRSEEGGYSHLERALLARQEVGLLPLAGLNGPDAAPASRGSRDWLRRDMTSSVMADIPNTMAATWDRTAIRHWADEWHANPEGMRQKLARRKLPSAAQNGKVELSFAPPLEDSLGSILPWELAADLDGASVIRRRQARDSHVDPVRSEGLGSGTVLIMADGRHSLMTDRLNLLSQYEYQCKDDTILELDQSLSPNNLSIGPHSDSETYLVHIEASIEDSKGGYALVFRNSSMRGYDDFDSSEFRPVTSRHLESFLWGLRSRPLVILEILAPENSFAAAEMLLQRNAFAQALYSPQLMRGLIATGLAPLDARAELRAGLIDAIAAGGSVGDIFAATRSAPFSAERGPGQYYWPRASALWCADPDAPVRGKGPPP